ncbi:uncharacterized protein UBRO_00512 [Ustilago bromivora]|uniref:Uncharacterized protein n=1 Tax=Ustilago bromivora TaxID=307758 RepID=A0A1K0H108_9BASI|nr:uncharacterized protein UBRO_00512 [Ustilago bromivora]SYW79137.1 uncharacterized protein UBRO2_02821 [Ustilago bromivora]
MTAPWAWRLDPSSGSSSPLGPSTSATLAATGPLSSLAHKTDAASKDGVFWQDFRASIKRTSLRDRKRAKLHRFDSDDVDPTQDEDTTIQTNEAGAGSEEEDANGVDETSSEGSLEDEAEEDDRDGAQGDKKNAIVIQGSPGNTPPTLPRAGVRGRKPKRAQAESAASSTQLIAIAIHTHSLANEFDSTHSIDSLPPPLTYKETVRLVRLIAMIFRFPKPRRISRRRHREQTSSEDTNAASSSSAPTSSPVPEATIGEATNRIELKPKYLSSPASSASSSRRPRMFAKVHPEDARPNSAAVLKLIALIPAALPARVGCAKWIVRVAVKARRDEHGNILLPDSAYEGASSRQQWAEKEGAEKNTNLEAADGEERAKVTRSMRQRMGQDAPSIPLPGFWHKQRTHIKLEGEEERKGEEGAMQLSDRAEIKAEPAEGNEVDALTCTTHPPELASDFTFQQSSSPQMEADVMVDPDETATQQTIRSGSPRVSSKVVNLSKLLAERMREKRQAKSLLLRTHHSLRKRKRDDVDTTGSVVADENGSVKEGDEIDLFADAETAANTLANSGRQNDAAETPQSLEATADANLRCGEVKQEDLS